MGTPIVGSKTLTVGQNFTKISESWFFEHLGCSDDFLTMINRFPGKFPIDIGGRKKSENYFLVENKNSRKIFFEKVKISKNHRKFQLFFENFHNEINNFSTFKIFEIFGRKWSKKSQLAQLPELISPSSEGIRIKVRYLGLSTFRVLLIAHKKSYI